MICMVAIFALCCLSYCLLDPLIYNFLERNINFESIDCRIEIIFISAMIFFSGCDSINLASSLYLLDKIIFGRASMRC